MDENSKASPRALPTTIEGKLARAMFHKEEGNSFFKEKLYKKAITAYGKVLAYTKGLPGSVRGMDGMASMAAKETKEIKVTADEEQQAVELECIVETNMATCYIKLNEPKKAVDRCKRALTLNQTSWKALLRQGEALAMLQDTDAASVSLEEALRYCHEPAGTNSIMKEKAKLAALDRRLYSQQKKIFAGVFDKLKIDDK